MLRKLAILATGAVIAFLLIALISGFFGIGRDESRKPIEVDPSRIPEHFQKPDATANRIPRPGEGAGGWIQRTDPKTGRLVQEFRYDKLEPLTEGEFKVTKPQARFHLALNRVIDIRANTGTIVAPQNIPQQGTFKDGVVVRLYETRKDQKLNLADDSQDIVATIHLQDATFNAQLGKLDSNGDVLLEGRNAEFRGRGLVLVYNEPQQRIDYLEITQGQYLKYTPPPETGGADSSAPATTKRPDETTPAADDGRVQFYQVQFDRSVHVRSGGRSIDSDDLLGYFAFNRRSNIARMQSSRIDDSDDVNTMLADAAPNAAALALAQAKPQPANPATEVVMTWAGKMVVTPVAKRPEGLRTDQDLLLNFRGRPVKMQSENGDVMTCALAQYHEFHRQVAAIGSGEFPLLIESPALGEVTADSLSLRLADQVGKLQGPGYIKAKAPPPPEAPQTAAAPAKEPVGENAVAAKPASVESKGLPPGFAIRWTDHVDLLLTQAKEKPAGLKTAQFVGKVEVNDPRFTMSGETLAVHFEPDRKGKSRRFSAIDASGNVMAQSEDGKILAQTLHMDTAESQDGKIRPTVLVASGDVQINDKTQAISAGALSATFTDKATINKGKARIDVAQITATDHVKVKLDDGSTAQADQLEADNMTGIATLTGRPVVVGKEGAQLRVAKLNLNRAKELATAEGKGRFDYEQLVTADKTRGEPSENATAETTNRKPQTANPITRTMHVTWTDGMTFDQGANLLTVSGDVKAEQSDRPEEENKLTAKSVVLEMMDRQLARKQGVELKGRSLLKRIDAKGDVVLLSSRWLDAKHEQLEARLRLEGPSVSFDNNRELARVNGAGSMLLEDYRKRTEAEAKAQNTAVQMNGRGATLFTWSRWMTMDGSKTSVVMDGNVEMTHRPSEKSPVLQMQTNRLTADMKGIGGIEALQASKTQKLDIDHIEAEGGVQLRDDKRLISAYHLYYDGASQTATLEAQDGRRVNVIQLDEPKPIRAQRIIWDLKKDRLEIDQPGY